MFSSVFVQFGRVFFSEMFSLVLLIGNVDLNFLAHVWEPLKSGAPVWPNMLERSFLSPALDACDVIFR